MTDASMLFNGWSSLLRILIIGGLGYVSLIVILRLSGNRTLSKMNSFDFVITIALGSTFASGLLQKSVSLADIVVAFALLVGLQFVTTWLAVYSQKFDNWLKGEPTILYANGMFLQKQMQKSHVTEEEVLAAVRERGINNMNHVDLVVLESNGKIAALGKFK